MSCMGTGLSYMVLATFIYLNNCELDLAHLQWIPVLSFATILFIASIGVLPIPYIILGEILPNKVTKPFHLNDIFLTKPLILTIQHCFQQIKGVMVPFCMCFSWFQAGLIVKGFPAVATIVGLHGCIYIFAACCFGGALYTIFCIPETKGRSLDDIEKSLRKQQS